jgi:hypothetical protein
MHKLTVVILGEEKRRQMGEKMPDGSIRMFEGNEADERERQTVFGRIFGTDKEVVSWIKK